MNTELRKNLLAAAVSLALLGGAGAAGASVNVQCPGDNDGDAAWNTPGEVKPPNVRCMHLVAGDGFSEMSDGHPAYTLGFSDRTGVKPADVIAAGMLGARWPGSTIALDQGDQFYLSLTNVGMVMRHDALAPLTALKLRIDPLLNCKIT